TCSSFASPVGTRDFWDESRVQTGCRRSQSPSPGLCPLAERGNHTSHRPTDRQRWRAREQRGYSKMIRRGGEETFTQQRSWKGQEPVLGCCHLLESSTGRRQRCSHHISGSFRLCPRKCRPSPPCRGPASRTCRRSS